MNSKPLPIISLYPEFLKKRPDPRLLSISKSFIQADAELNRLKMCALTQVEQSLPHNYSGEAHLCLNIQFYKGFKMHTLTNIGNFVGVSVGSVHQIWGHLCKWLLRRVYNKWWGGQFQWPQIVAMVLVSPSTFGSESLNTPTSCSMASVNFWEINWEAVSLKLAFFKYGMFPPHCHSTSFLCSSAFIIHVPSCWVPMYSSLLPPYNHLCLWGKVAALRQPRKLWRKG